MYSFDINDSKQSSLDTNSDDSKNNKEDGGGDKYCCESISHKTMLNFVMTIDCILLLRLLPACLSRKSMNNLKCYYSFRIATFWILMAATVLGFLYLCWLVVLEKTAAYTPIIQAIVLGFIALIDYNFCAVVRTQLMKVIKKDRKKQRKIKGRMLS